MAAKMKKRKKHKKLDYRHYQAIELLAYKGKRNYAHIAKEVGVDRTTLFRWRQRKDFSRLYAKRMEQRFRGIKRRRRASQPTAMDAQSIENLFRALDII
jgi:transposase-like protein